MKAVKLKLKNVGVFVVDKGVIEPKLF